MVWHDVLACVGLALTLSACDRNDDKSSDDTDPIEATDDVRPTDQTAVQPTDDTDPAHTDGAETDAGATETDPTDPTDTDPTDSDPTDTDPTDTDPTDTDPTDGADTDVPTTTCLATDPGTGPTQADGLCLEPGWCWSWPLPHDREIFGVDGACLDDLWTAGALGIVGHWDGIGWTHWVHPDRPTWKVVARGESLTWLAADNGVIASHDGASFTSYSAPIFQYVTGIEAFADNDVWVFTHDGLRHYDGSTWSSIAGDVGRVGSATAPDDVWSIPLDVTTTVLLHFNGTIWNDVPLPVTSAQEVYDIHAASSEEVWVLAGDGVHRWTPAGWTSWTLPSQVFGLNAWLSIHARSPTDVVVRAQEVTWDFDGVDWTLRPTSTYRTHIYQDIGVQDWRVSVGRHGAIVASDATHRVVLGGNPDRSALGYRPTHQTAVTRMPDGELALFGVGFMRPLGDGFVDVAPGPNHANYWRAARTIGPNTWAIRHHEINGTSSIWQHDGTGWTELASGGHPGLTARADVFEAPSGNIYFTASSLLSEWDGSQRITLGGMGSGACSPAWMNATGELVRTCGRSSSSSEMVVWRSTDAGRTWTEETRFFAGTNSPQYTMEREDGTVLVFETDQVWTWDGTTLTQTTLPVDYAYAFWANIAREHDGVLYVGGQLHLGGGLAVLDANGWTIEPIGPRPVSGMHIDDDGTIWVANDSLMVREP